MASAVLSGRQKSMFRVALCALACAVVTTGVRAQDTSSTTTQKGPANYETQIKSGTVVYVSGNDLVVKGDSGVVKHFVVPDSQRFNVDGKMVSVHELTPGTHLTANITTKTTPTMVTTTRTIEGKVWYVNAPSMVILRLPDGTNKEYKVPKGQMFTIGGKQQSVFHLRKGMDVSAQVVTEEPVTEVSSNTSVSGAAPTPAMPATVGVLLVESPQQPTQTASAAPEPAPKMLPKTGSEWPLVGLLGIFSLGAGALTRRLRMGLK